MSASVAELHRPAARPSAPAQGKAGHTGPILIVLAIIVALWYAFAVYLNAPFQKSLYERDGQAWTFADLVRDTLYQERPVLPVATPGGGGDLEDDRRSQADTLQAQPRLSRLGDAFLDAARLRHGDSARHSARGRHRPQPRRWIAR